MGRESFRVSHKWETAKPTTKPTQTTNEWEAEGRGTLATIAIKLRNKLMPSPTCGFG